MDLVMELASGGSLWQRLKQGPPSERDAQRMLADLLRAIAQCHAAGVVVRDVKPDNFLFVSGRPGAALKMADFGYVSMSPCGTALRCPALPCTALRCAALPCPALHCAVLSVQPNKHVHVS